MSSRRLKRLKKVRSKLFSANRTLKLCLCMIVKNEEHLIRSALEHLLLVVPDIDCWCIEDTGSTDKTPQIIEEVFKSKGLPGHLKRRPWQDFGYNRTEALNECFGLSEYILMFDADDRIEGKFPSQDWDKHARSLIDGFMVRFSCDKDKEGAEYWRQSIFRNDRQWSYKGVLHEYPCSNKCNPDVRHINDEGYHFDSRRTGARNLNPNKYKDDVQTVVTDLKKNPNDARNTFYAAQSCYDAEMFDDAVHWYKQRIYLGPREHRNGRYITDLVPAIRKEKNKKTQQAITTNKQDQPDRDEEMYFSALRIGEICRSKGKLDEAEQWLRDSQSYALNRYEPLLRLLQVLGQQNKWAEAYKLCVDVPLPIPLPELPILYVFKGVYDYHLPWMCAEVASHVGDRKLTITFLSHMLNHSKLLSEDNRAKIRSQLEQSLSTPVIAPPPQMSVLDRLITTGTLQSSIVETPTHIGNQGACGSVGSVGSVGLIVTNDAEIELETEQEHEDETEEDEGDENENEGEGEEAEEENWQQEKRKQWCRVISLFAASISFVSFVTIAGLLIY